MKTVTINCMDMEENLHPVKVDYEESFEIDFNGFYYRVITVYDLDKNPNVNFWDIKAELQNHFNTLTIEL